MNAKAAFSHCCVLVYFLLPAPVLAEVDASSEAYKSGQSAGKIVGYVILGLIVFVVIRKLLKK